MTNFAYGITATRLRGEEVDDGYNGTRLDWDDPDELAITGCAIAPRVEPELRDRGRQGVHYAWTLYAPYGSDIRFADRMRVDGQTYEVEGHPGLWRNPYTGREPGMTVYLQRIDG